MSCAFGDVGRGRDRIQDFLSFGLKASPGLGLKPEGHSLPRPLVQSLTGEGVGATPGFPDIKSLEL